MLTLANKCSNVQLGIEKHILREVLKMKKLIAILVVLAIVAGAVFAVTNDKIVLTSDVKQIKPEYKIYSKVDKSTDVGSEAGKEVDTEMDISEEDIEWTFVISQRGETKGTTAVEYSRYKGSVTLTVTLYPFTKSDDSTVSQATAYKVKSVAPGANVTDKLTITAGDAGAASTTLNLVYAGKKVDDQVVGTVVGEWTHDPDLAMDGTGTDAKTVYKADVKLTYSVQ